jgi:hypothetical protein
VYIGDRLSDFEAPIYYYVTDYEMLTSGFSKIRRRKVFSTDDLRAQGRPEATLVLSVHRCGSPLVMALVLKRTGYGFRGDAYFFLKVRAAFPGIPR